MELLILRQAQDKFGTALSSFPSTEGGNGIGFFEPHGMLVSSLPKAAGVIRHVRLGNFGATIYLYAERPEGSRVGQPLTNLGVNHVSKY
jgi:hypothetical protein